MGVDAQSNGKPRSLLSVNLSDPHRASSALVKPPQVSRKLITGGRARRQALSRVISCVKSPLLFLHSSGCISSHLRGCCSSPGRGRTQLLLDVWAAGCPALSACLSLSCGNLGCSGDSQARDARMMKPFRDTVAQEGGWKAGRNNTWNFSSSSSQKPDNVLKKPENAFTLMGSQRACFVLKSLSLSILSRKV